MKLLRVIVLAACFPVTPHLVAGWGTPCNTEITVETMFARVSAIARCKYETFGKQDNSVWISGEHSLTPGNRTVVCSGYGYAGCSTEVSPYTASTTYVSIATFTGSQMGVVIDTIKVDDSETTPDPRRPHTVDDSDPCPSPSCTPIIIDLGTDGYRLTSIAGGVRFDVRDEGQTRQTSWTARGVNNAFLALDRNGNRRIDNGAELFGEATRLQSGARAPNGFAALAEVDGNGDGTVDANDPVWETLLLWTDRNHDGASTADELQRIADSTVTALSTGYQTIGKKDEWGNLFRYKSAVALRTDSSRKFYDVLLQIEP